MAGDRDRRQRLCAAIAGFNETMRRLGDLGIDLSRPGRDLLADLRARQAAIRRQHADLQVVQRAADRQVLPELLDLYLAGSDADRRFARAVLSDNPSFRWGVGWGLGGRIGDAEDARRALAVLSMKDGGSDWRDEILALDL